MAPQETAVREILALGSCIREDGCFHLHSGRKVSGELGEERR